MPPTRKLKKFTRSLRPTMGSFAIRCLGRLPLPMARPVGKAIARVTYLSRARAVQISRDNIQRCLPHLSPTQREALVKESLVQTAITALEAPAIWAQPYTKLRSYIVGTEGFELIEAQQATGRGLLLLAPHLGNWEFLGPVLPRRLEQLTYMYQPTGMPTVDKLIVQGRSKDGVKLAPTSRKGVSQVLKALQGGEVVAILPDQVPDEGAGHVAEFFAQPAYTMTLVYKLIQRTGCDVLMIYGKRVPKGFHLVVREADPAIKDSDLRKSLDALNHSVELCVMEVPEQYQWEYKRFKGTRQNPTLPASD